MSAANPAVGHHPLAYAAPNAYHQMRCKATNSRIRSHNTLTTVTASTLATDAQFEADCRNHLQSSDTSRRQIDGLLTAAHRARPLCFDTTLACPFLPSYLAAAIDSSEAIFLSRASAKIAKHAAGCAALGRDFIPFVLTTLGGVGPPAFRDFLRGVYSSLAASAIASGASGADAAHAFADLQQRIQATIARANAIAVRRHTSDP